MCDKLKKQISELRLIQNEFRDKFGVPDALSSSKFFEVIIANELDHRVIAGFSGFRDAKDDENNEYEYKHYKESSSNHTWTFNDFSDATIQSLCSIKAVVFAHIDDSKDVPFMDWCYIVPGRNMSDFLRRETIKIKNTRKMINVSPLQLERQLSARKLFFEVKENGRYSHSIKMLFKTIKEIEATAGTKNILTSNKIWEVLIASKLNHRALTEQTKFDAVDRDGNYYEYKVSKGYSWNFEDISSNVLNKFQRVKKIVLATIDKEALEIVAIFEADPSVVIPLLKKKLDAKKKKYSSKGGLRRLQVALSSGDLRRINAKKVL